MWAASIRRARASSRLLAKEIHVRLNYTLSRRAVLLGGLAGWIAGCTSGRAGDLGYSVAVDGEGNRVGLSRAGDIVWVDVRSERGIGTALIFIAAPVPQTLRFRLYLTGLEKFRLWWDGRTVTASVSLADPRAVQAWSRTDDQPDAPITPASPDWLEIVQSPERASFEVAPPPVWQTAQPTHFGIGWIDAFR